MRTENRNNYLLASLFVSNNITDCLNRAEYEYGLEYESGAQFVAEERNGQESRDVVTDHPFIALKKLLGDGSFYYSLDFNLTDRLQDRYVKRMH